MYILGREREMVVGGIYVGRCSLCVKYVDGKSDADGKGNEVGRK